jgi:predicted glycoside hydrolase/deacetylase ChbG (UPF0249 family)
MSTLTQAINPMENNFRENIIIAADDFGISKTANETILHLAASKKIDRVAVMALGEITQEDAANLKATGVKLDLHLDILHEYDQAKRAQRSSAILRSFGFLYKFLLGKISPKKILPDWENQLVKFQELFNCIPDGINSHEHVHFFPSYFKLALELAKKHGIEYIRLGKQTNPVLNPVSLILNFLRKADLKNLKKSGFESSDFLVSIDWIENIETFLKTSKQKTELVCHPENSREAELIEKYF